MAVKAARERAHERTRRHGAEDGDRVERARGVPQGRALLRRHRAQGRRRRRLARRRRRDGRARQRRHRARRRLGAAVPAGRHRPDPGARRARRVGRRVDARRRVHGRLRAAVHGDERRGRSAVGLPRRGRHDDLGRHPQARLRAEGRVGARAPHEGAAALPDVRLRRLARRVLRVAGHAGHRGRACRWRPRGR